MPAPATTRVKTLDTFTLHLLHRAGQMAKELFHDQLRRHAVTPRQFALLLAIHSKPGRIQSELVKISGIDRSTLAEMLTRLAARGLIEKDAVSNDRRANSIKLTGTGRRLLRKCEAGAGAAEAHMLAPMTAARRRNFLSSLALIVETDPHKAREKIRPGKPASSPKPATREPRQTLKLSRPPGAI